MVKSTPVQSSDEVEFVLALAVRIFLLVLQFSSLSKAGTSEMSVVYTGLQSEITCKKECNSKLDIYLIVLTRKDSRFQTCEQTRFGGCSVAVADHKETLSN